MQEWFEAGACDEFNITPAQCPAAARISSTWWFPNCGAAGCFAPSMRVSPYGKVLGCDQSKIAPVGIAAPRNEVLESGATSRPGRGREIWNSCYCAAAAMDCSALVGRFARRKVRIWRTASGILSGVSFHG